MYIKKRATIINIQPRNKVIKSLVIACIFMLLQPRKERNKEYRAATTFLGLIIEADGMTA